ncbi:MAG: thiol-disulfide oxidoreductase [Confluentimicrobium sp.]|jgi:protein-disulfide isomerase|uniref:DsbA family protein n=1 Tax=Actibacterium sp. TaxID=1872125 RepID=UPI00050FCE76|nr:DsbA family protein [Actibacterium sp.]KGB83230.1 thiol-disulfide oxidoreductase [Rhodovulum sp. NI22]MBC55376.1 thiol-disulfide oxidoreductase [Actibacterium sp.]MDY6858202.1 DsbA family protein [Pseudomonadota bacterium]|tara:strand:- start:450 stop:1085 length:636 start_codon:yes stop_codon:yes gene_type:complete
MNRRTALTLGTAALVMGRGTWLSAQENAAMAGDGDAPVIADMTLGAEDAPVTVIEYASFTCPHCATFHENVLSRFKADYVDTGKVRFIYREVYFDRPGLWAAMVARCGGEMRYFGIVDMLYEKQREWIGDGTPAEIAQNLKKIGRTAGLSDEQLDACFADAETAQAMVAHYEEVMKEYDISGTPTLVIDGEVHSNMNYKDLREIVDARLVD